MALAAPQIDSRTSLDIAEQTRKLLCHYLKEAYGWPADADGGEAGKALTGIFAHYGALITDRINAAPAKNQLAFLDLLGNSLLPAVAAQVPVTFALDPGATAGVTLPAATRVQAAAPDGSTDPIVFETVSDVWVSPFEIKAISREFDAGTPPLDMEHMVWSALHPLRRTEKISNDERIFDKVETFYIGLDLPANRPLEADRPLSLHFFIDAPGYDPGVPGALRDAARRVVWEYGAWDDEPEPGQPRWRWQQLYAEDSTQLLTCSGTVQLLVPADFVKVQRHRFEKRLYWLRAYLLNDRGGRAVYAPAPRWHGVALNTTMARQATSIHGELLGSSDGSARQVFTTFRKPVLPGQLLEVMERPLTDGATASTQGQEWLPWQEVSTFHASGPGERHYILDRNTGEVRFGDGRNGMIPPPGVRNICMRRYQTGGGTAGNVAAGAIHTLADASMAIDKVSNLVPAAGGAAPETEDALLERAPRALRHRGRAATREDFEDLALLSTPEVARALCVPLIDLGEQPTKWITSAEDELAGAGKLSVIVVPRGRDTKPVPSQVLLRTVQASLRACSLATSRLAVVGPLYLRVDIDLRIKLDSLSVEDRVQRDLQRALSAYLHPLTGRVGQGWSFGRRPQASDIYRVLQSIPGIHHVARLDIKLAAEEIPMDCDALNAVDRILRSGRFLIHSGQHMAHLI